MTDAVAVAWIAGSFMVLATGITAGFAYLTARIKDVHHELNSRLTEFINQAQKLGHSEGVADERGRVKE